MPATPELLSVLQSRVSALPKGLRDHIYRVRDLAQELASRHGIDPGRAELAVLAHDVARAVPGAELLDLATQMDLSVGPVERRLPVLLHGPVGAESLRRDEGLGDAEILQAVTWHSTGHPDLGPLGKLVFIADKLDPQKAAAYPYQPELRHMADEDLGTAVLGFLSREVVGHINRREPVHPASIETINSLLEESAGSAGQSHGK